ncbi:hypothetical protein QF047_001892 [Arthrobacter sp. W4I7]|nr:hypothetical protein [Arthrobacter sp. W4I7]
MSTLPLVPGFGDPRRLRSWVARYSPRAGLNVYSVMNPAKPISHRARHSGVRLSNRGRWKSYRPTTRTSPRKTVMIPMPHRVLTWACPLPGVKPISSAG